MHVDIHFWQRKTHLDYISQPDATICRVKPIKEVLETVINRILKK